MGCRRTKTSHCNTQTLSVPTERIFWKCRPVFYMCWVFLGQWCSSSREEAVTVGGEKVGEIFIGALVLLFWDVLQVQNVIWDDLAVFGRGRWVSPCVHCLCSTSPCRPSFHLFELRWNFGVWLGNDELINFGCDSNLGLDLDQVSNLEENLNTQRSIFMKSRVCMHVCRRKTFLKFRIWICINFKNGCN